MTSLGVVLSVFALTASGAIATEISNSSISMLMTTITTPSAAQLRYQSTDFVALIHFNMGTFAHNGDPSCDEDNWNVLADYATGKTSDPATFSPFHLNVTQWFDSITALGANIAVLTAKHGCGFCLWPTEVNLPDGSRFGYNVMADSATTPAGGVESAVFERNVVQEFVDVANARGVGYGFYYSVMKSFYLCRSSRGENSCMKEVLPGQHNVSDEEFLSIATAQVTELWTKYGNLTEIWIDSALPSAVAKRMVSLQPRAVGTPTNPKSWCGTESGHPSRDVGQGPVWSTGWGHHGNVTSNQWIPKYCDPQLFVENKWFWEPNLAVRTLGDMIPIYHDIVGRGMVMELAFSINRDGLVDESHAVIYKELGNWVRQCYGTPVASTSGVGTKFELIIRQGDRFDRILLEEDIVLGQRARNYTVVIGDDEVIASGSAIGRKRIHVLPSQHIALNDFKVHLIIQDFTAIPQLKLFSVFQPCPTNNGKQIDRIASTALE